MNWAQLRKYTPKEWLLKAFCLCLKHSLFPYVAEQCSEKGLSSELSHQSAITECFDSLETLFRNHSKMAQLGDNINNATCTIYPTCEKTSLMTRRFQSATGPIAGVVFWPLRRDCRKFQLKWIQFIHLYSLKLCACGLWEIWRLSRGLIHTLLVILGLALCGACGSRETSARPLWPPSSDGQ